MITSTSSCFLRRLCLASLITLCLIGCSDPIHRRTDYAMGTLIEITVYDAPDAEAATSAVVKELNRMERLLSVRRPDSELSRVNAAIAVGKTPIELSKELAAILIEAKAYSRQTNNLFNPAIGNLVALWGFSEDDSPAKLPDSEAIVRLVASNPSMDDLVIKRETLICANDMVSIDLGGYAKGLALDRAATILINHGVQNALINIGGNVLALGKRGDRPWTVGIRDPRANRAFATLALADREAVGTSGDYQRFFTVDGRRHHHLIDPRTGYPADRVAAVTIVVRDPIRAGTLSDVFSKPLFIEGLPKTASLARSLGIADVLVTTTDGKPYATASLRSRLKQTSAPVDLISETPRKNR